MQLIYLLTLQPPKKTCGSLQHINFYLFFWYSSVNKVVENLYTFFFTYKACMTVRAAKCTIQVKVIVTSWWMTCFNFFGCFFLILENITSLGIAHGSYSNGRSIIKQLRIVTQQLFSYTVYTHMKRHIDCIKMDKTSPLSFVVPKWSLIIQDTGPAILRFWHNLEPESTK